MEILDGTEPLAQPAPGTCPSQLALQLLSNKWSPRLIHALLAGPVRTNELRRQLAGISQKVLAQTLRELQASGLVVRNVHGDSAIPHVEYALTGLGRSLSAALVPVDQWVQANRGSLGE